MFEWKVEEQRLTNDEGNGQLDFNRRKIYSFEDKVSREDKIAFVDGHSNGWLSYMLDLCERFEKEKKGLAKDQYGNPKTVSLKAWLKRNDSRKIVDSTYHYGKYTLMSCTRHIQHSGDTNYKGYYDTFTDLVDELFHRILCQCEKGERAYFRANDEGCVAREKLYSCIEKYNTTFGISVSTCISSDFSFKVIDNGNEREMTMEEIKKMLEMFRRLEENIETLSREFVDSNPHLQKETDETEEE